jgi:hypothetical protein
MSDMRDPRLDPSHPDYRNPKADYEPRAAYDSDGMNWSWILGGIGALVVLLLALSYWSGGDRQTAGDTTPPATTTGQSAPRVTPPATTGQGSTRPAPAPSSPPPSSNQ